MHKRFIKSLRKSESIQRKNMDTKFKFNVSLRKHYFERRPFFFWMLKTFGFVIL